MADLDPPVDPGRDHVLGRDDAPMTLVEYGDYQCPHCADAQDVVARVREELGDDLRFVFRHLPIPSSHPDAEPAAIAAEAAGRQGSFWEMHERLYDHQEELSPEELAGHAEALGLDVDRFREDFGDSDLAARVDADVDSALTSGAAGTPSFFVEGFRYRGPYDAEALEEALRRGIA